METEPGEPASTVPSIGTTAPSPSSSSPSGSTTTSTNTTTTSATASTTNSTSSSSSSTTTAGRQAVPQISVYSGIPDRQTVQALHRQPNTAAQYLQQMYAAQQQHLMLQTAALQQQHNLSTAQLQSLAQQAHTLTPACHPQTSETASFTALFDFCLWVGKGFGTPV
uniref:Polyhomeotic-like protein 2 n=1 Tax=Neogobius melanostomus TaxID=47308 RepID=A0A8C6STV8_9GOBI